MLLLVIPAVIAPAAVWAAWSLYRIWQAVPRCNADLAGL